MLVRIWVLLITYVFEIPCPVSQTIKFLPHLLRDLCQLTQNLLEPISTSSSTVVLVLVMMSVGQVLHVFSQKSLDSTTQICTSTMYTLCPANSQILV